MKRRNVIASAGLTIAQLWAVQAMADTDSDAARFMQKYNYCDAKILAGHWSISTYDAKARGGLKLGANAAPVVEAGLTAGRTAGKRCDFSDTGFSYDDAAALAKLWGSSVEDAKASLAQKLTDGARDLAKSAIAEAHAANKPAAGKPGAQVKPIGLPGQKPTLKPIKPVKPVKPKTPKQP